MSNSSVDDQLTVAPPLLVTLKEASRRSGRSVSGLYSDIKTGRIQARKWGTRTLVVYASLEALISDLEAPEMAPRASISDDLS